MNRNFFIAVFAFCAIASGTFAQERKAAGKYEIGDKEPGGGIVFYLFRKRIFRQGFGRRALRHLPLFGMFARRIGRNNVVFVWK